MPTIEELLAQFEVSDDDDPDEDTTLPADSAPMKQLREWGKGLEKKLREVSKENRELAEFKAQKVTAQRQSEAEGFASSLELPTGVAKLYLERSEGNDISEDGMRQFAADYDLAPGLLKGVGGKTEEKSQGFEPGAGGAAAAPGPKVYSREEWLSIVAKDPDLGRKLFESGKVDMTEIDRLAPSSRE